MTIYRRWFVCIAAGAALTACSNPYAPLFSTLNEMAELDGPIAVESEACGFWDRATWEARIIATEVKWGMDGTLLERFRASANRRIRSGVEPRCSGFLRETALQSLVNWSTASRPR